MPESLAKKPMDHTGMFWIHCIDILAMSGKENADIRKNMIDSGWSVIPTAWKEDGESKRMEKLQTEYDDPKRERVSPKILNDMMQLMTDCALRNNMIRGDMITRG